MVHQPQIVVVARHVTFVIFLFFKWTVLSSRLCCVLVCFFFFFLIFVCKQCRVSCAQSTYPYSGSSSWLLPQFGRVHFYAHIAFFVWLRWHFVASLCGTSLSLAIFLNLWKFHLQLCCYWALQSCQTLLNEHIHSNTTLKHICKRCSQVW